MATLEESLTEGLGPDAKPHSEPSWDEVDAQFPKGTSDEDRNNARMQYFNSVVRPKIKDPRQLQPTYEEFLRRTERPWTDRADEIGKQIGGKIGDFIVDSAEMAALFEVAGPLTGGLARTLMGAGTAANIAGKIARGGVAFGAYDALKAKDGDRVGAGLRGAAVGTAWELGLGYVFGFEGKKAADALNETVTNKANSETPIPPHATAPPKPRPTMEEELRAAGAPPTERPPVEVPPVQKPTPPTMGHAAAEVQQAGVDAARKRGMTKEPMHEVPGMQGIHITLSDAEGNSVVHQVTRLKETEIQSLIEETLQNGGALDKVEFGPASYARATRFMRYFSEKGEAAERTFRMKVPSGTVEAMADALHRRGLLSTVLDDSTVSVGPETQAVQGQRAAELAKTVADPAAAGALPDDVSRTMMRIGQLRNETNFTKSRRAVYEELHRLRGDIGGQYQLTREQVGQLALDYFERNAGAAEPESAIPLLDRFKGAGEKFGVKLGERPTAMGIPESRLEGFYKAIPASERLEFKLDELTGETRVRPVGTTKWLDLPSEELGLRGGQVMGPEGPMRFLAKDATEGDMYHEAVHDGLMHADLHEDIPDLAKGHEETLYGITQGLAGEADLYMLMLQKDRANEALVHAMEALRMGDTARLQQLADYDISVDHVKDFVNTTAGNAYVRTLEMEQTAPIRALQRRLTDAVRRTSPDIAENLVKGQAMGYTTWWDPEAASWIMRDGEGREILQKDLNGVWDELHNADVSDHFPDIAHQAYFSGIRGPFVPPGTESIAGPPGTPELDRLPIAWPGRFMRNALDAFSSVAQRIAKLAPNAPDLYGPAATLQQVARDANRTMREIPGTELGTLLKGVNDSKKMAIGELLARPDGDWASIAEAHQLTEEDLMTARAVSEWDERHFQGKLKTTLKTVAQVREAGGNLSRIGGDPAVLDAIRNSRLGYSDLHVNRTSQWLMRSNYEQALSEPTKVMEDLAWTYRKTPRIRDGIDNYIASIRGAGDGSEEVLTDFGNAWNARVNEALTRINKHLPVNMQMEAVPLKDVVTTLRALWTAGGVGLRPAGLIRDVAQGSMNGMTAIGPQAFMEGMAQFVREGPQEAEAAGALFGHRNVAEMAGDITSELPRNRAMQFVNQAADKVMAPNRVAHNGPRAITFYGAKSAALRDLARLDSNAITSAEFADGWGSGMRFHDSPERKRLLDIALDRTIPAEERARQIALSVTTASQYGGLPGEFLRSKTGRIFGQFGTWPANHFEFGRKLLRRAAENPAKGGAPLALWVGMNYGMIEAAKSIGADVSKWAFFSPMAWTGSPPLELVQNILKASDETPEGRRARHDVLMTPFELIPGANQGRRMMRAWRKGDMTALDWLGFNKMKETPDQDLLEWSIREAGFTPKDFE